MRMFAIFVVIVFLIPMSIVAFALSLKRERRILQYRKILTDLRECIDHRVDFIRYKNDVPYHPSVSELIHEFSVLELKDR